MIQCFIECTVNEKVHNLIEDAHEQALACTSTELYEMVQQAAAKTKYLEEANDLINNKVGKFSESKDFTGQVIHHLTNSATIQHLSTAC